jgi:hypothetical protein
MDSVIISQALIKLPSLVQVVVGDRYCFDGRQLRSSIGANQLGQIVCPTGHCTTTLGFKTVYIAYCTVVLALHQIEDHPNDLKLGISLERADCEKLQTRRPGLNPRTLRGTLLASNYIFVSQIMTSLVCKSRTSSNPGHRNTGGAV